MALRPGKYRQPVNDQGEGVHSAHLQPALYGQPPSKLDTHLRFYLCQDLRPILLQLEAVSKPHTPRIRMGPSLQRKGPGRGTPPLLVPNCRPSLPSKSILVPAIAFFTASMSERWVSKTDIIGVRGDTCPLITDKENSPQGWICPLIPSLRSRGSKVKT